MNLRSIDLNLLVILDVLLDEAHVTRAATRLTLSQPSTSAALSRLRYLFNDPLLERADGAMRLTPVAKNLRGQLKDLLGGARALLKLEPLDVSSVRQAVRISTADHVAAIIADRLHGEISRTSPGIDLVFQPYAGSDSAVEDLTKGSIDLAVSILPMVSPPIHREELMRDEWRVVMRSDHPARKGFDVASWLAWPHLFVSGSGETRGQIDDRLADLDLSRRIALVVPSFLMVAPLVSTSDLIGLAPRRTLPLRGWSNLVDLDPPVRLADIPLHVAWHSRREGDVAVQHVRNLLKAVMQGAVID